MSVSRLERTATSGVAPVRDHAGGADASSFDPEHARALRALDAALARREEAEHRLARRAEEARTSLRVLLETARRELAEMEREHEDAVEAIRSGANDEAERVLRRARGGANVAAGARPGQLATSDGW